MKGDQLLNSIKNGLAFVGFQEGTITFKPTFKKEKGSTLNYIAKRSPSYCDRVLYRIDPHLRDKGHVKYLEYKSVPEVVTSDHVPVMATLQVDVFKKEQNYKQGENYYVVEISSIDADGLIVADITGSSDPYANITLKVFLSHQLSYRW